MEIIGRQFAQRLSIGRADRNTLTFVPDDFNYDPAKKYPLLMVHPGSGEVSQNGGINALLKNGINKMIADGWNPYVNTPTAQKFIVFTVQQDSTGYALTPENMFNALRNNKMIAGRYREDSIFVTGLSLGACATCYFFENTYAREYLPKVAGLVPMSGQRINNQQYDFEFIKANPKPVWAFCGLSDTLTRRAFMEDLVEDIPGIVATWYAGGHNGWIEQYKKKQANGFTVLEWCASLIPKEIPVIQVEAVFQGGGVVGLSGAVVTETSYLQYGVNRILYTVK